MKSTARSVAAAASLVLALGMTLVLAGCGGDEKTASVPDRSTVSVDSDGGSATLRSDLTTGKDLPDGFPAADVPVVDGRIIGGARGAEGSPYAWSVILLVTGGADETFDQITGKLADAGFTASPGMDTDKVHTGQFRSTEYDVTVSVAGAESSTSVTYLVRNAD